MLCYTVMCMLKALMFVYTVDTPDIKNCTRAKGQVETDETESGKLKRKAENWKWSSELKIASSFRLWTSYV